MQEGRADLLPVRTKPKSVNPIPMKSCLLIFLVGSISGATLFAKEDVPVAKYTIQFVKVERDVKLEVVDWGGSGKPLILLAGLGADAHVYDEFAPKLAATCHVYGITRRGFGASSVPVDGYSADRLGDDVLAVIDSLKIDRPVLVGHSLAGEELSSVGTRHPDKIAGLIYLEAAYSYAFFDRSAGDLVIDSIELRKRLEQLLPGKERGDPKKLIAEILEALPPLEKGLKQRQKDLQSMPDPEKETGPQPPEPEVPLPIQGIFAGQQKYSAIHVPILALYAMPHAFAGMFANDPAGRAKAEAEDMVRVGAQAKALEAGVPSARVVRLAHATHFIFNSNEAEVLREMNAFLRTLP